MGKSYSQQHPNGERRVDTHGQEIAAKSLRKTYRLKLASDYPEEVLERFWRKYSAKKGQN